MNKTSYDLVDSHTYVVGGVHLISAMVFVPHGEFVQLTGDVISSTSIGVPIHVNVVGGIVAINTDRSALRRSSERHVETLK